MRGFRFFIIILCLAILAAIGVYLENSSQFSRLKNSLQCDSISSGILNYGPMGKILKRMDYVQLTANDNTRFKKTADRLTDLELITFQKKRHVNDFLFQATPFHSEQLSRLRGIPNEVKEKPGWPILSIVADNKYLYDPEMGIIANREKKGRLWERKARVSLIEKGQVVFSSAAGLRIHGGKRRTIKPYNSFRLYFRNEYGVESLPDDLLFDNNKIPIRTLVVHTTDWPPKHPLNNPLAYDVARRIGCLAPQTRLVEIYLNNQSLGMGYVTEHFSRKQWQYHLGHKEFAFYKFRGNLSEKDKRMYVNVFWKHTTNRDPLTFKKVGDEIDLDNMSRQIFAWAFCGTTDYCQGVGVFDYQKPKAKLFWLTWDMDHSFYDIGAARKVLSRKNWQQPAFKMFYFKGRHKCGRPKLFSRLMDESPEYRDFYINLITGLLNHRLTREYLLSRVSYYKKMLNDFGSPHSEYIVMLQEFMNNRPDFMRKDMVHYFKLKGPYQVNLLAPADKEFVIDGYSEPGSYRGEYFSGYPCTIHVKENSKNGFSHWLVDGEKKSTDSLRIEVKKETTIEAVFSQNS